jgi:chromosome segregation ATPase
MRDLEGNTLTLIAVVSALIALIKAAYDVWAGRRKDQQALEISKRNAPHIQKQLELGNFKAAMEGVNIAQTIMSQELSRLHEREKALEAESAGWESKALAAEARALQAEQRALTAETRAHKVESLLARLEDRCNRLENEIRQLGGRGHQADPSPGAS